MKRNTYYQKLLKISKIKFKYLEKNKRFITLKKWKKYCNSKKEICICQLQKNNLKCLLVLSKLI